MTCTITPAPRRTRFDAAFEAAVAAGWLGRCAFDACVLMKASGMSDGMIEAAFLDAARRVQ